MSLLTPIINQMELDRDRLRDLVNGTDLDTVQLEDRVEQSIAGQVKTRIDELSIDLSGAVQDAQDYSIASMGYRDESQTLLNQTQLLRNETEGFKNTTDVIKNDTQLLKNETGIIRDEVQGIYDSIGAEAGFLPRYEVESIDVSALATSELEINFHTVFRINGALDHTLTFPEADVFAFEPERAQSVIVFVEDSGGTITWPPEVSWAGGNEPELGTTWTNIVLFWTGTMWIGMESAKR